MKRTLAITIETELLDTLKELAQRENRTVSNLVETALIRYLEGSK